MSQYSNQTVGTIAAENPGAVRVFEAAGIDYCCGGKLPLETACERANVPVERVLRMLLEIESSQQDQDVRDWKQASTAELVSHIVEKHHGFIRREIPRLEALLVKVNGRHGAQHRELAEIQELFIAAAQELQAHLLKEERVLFPHIEALEAAIRFQRPAPRGCFPSVEFPIARMLADHDDAGELFARIKRLSNDYVPPEDACQSYRALYGGLAGFEQDLHRHVHLENNILFPQAIELERGIVPAKYAGR